MYGNDSLPSRIYSYGAKVPIEGVDLVDAQMELARRYRNALVRVERKRRDRVDAALRALSPVLTEVEAAIEVAKASLAEARAVIDRASAMARKKVYPPSASAACSAAEGELRRLWKERKAVRNELFASPGWRPIKEKPVKGKKPVRRKKSIEEKKAIGETIGGKIDEWASAQAKRLYAAIGRIGLYWGTRLFVGTTVKKSGPPPQFSRRDGSGHLAVEVQNGISPEEAFSGQNTLIQIEPLPTEESADFTGPRLSKAAMKRTKVRFRIGSNADRSPVFAVVPVVLHGIGETGKRARPIPPDARIKWVYLIRRRIATHCEWRVQFVLSRARGWGKPDRATDGQVQIDVGWRVTGDDGKTPRPDGSMRVAYWKGSDYREDELTLPADWLSQMRKVEDLQSKRDGTFNVARDALADWLAAKGKDIPAWVAERAANLRQWRSEARLAALVAQWRNRRFVADAAPFAAGHPLSVHLMGKDPKGYLGLTGSEGMYGLMEAWRKRDKHLFEYEENLRDQLQRRREDIYRCFAAMMCMMYRIAKVEKLDLRDFHELPEAEDAVRDGALKEHVRDACLSTLFRCIKEAMTEMIEVSPKNTTAKCHVCGSLQTWNRKILRHTCTACGAEWDQDANAAINIGAASAPVA